MTDAVVIGAGPAGMAAATLLARHGAATLLLDEQPGPGGQVYRGIAQAPASRVALLGKDYARGAAMVDALRGSGAECRFGHAVWQAGPAGEIWFSHAGRSGCVRAAVVVLATGAMERPAPVPGWTLPGAMTAGAVQTLLKTAGLVPRGAVLAGSGPLLFLLAAQLLDAGAAPAAVLDTAPPGNRRAALPLLRAALPGAKTLAKGFMLQAALRASGVPWHRFVTGLRIEGGDRVAAVRFRAGGAEHRIETGLVALHEGVIPAQQVPRSLGCAQQWDAGQRAFRPVLDPWGNTSVAEVLVAGDAGGIAGARAAEYAGRLAALEALRRLGRLDQARRDALAAPERRALAREQAVRPFLDALFAPAQAVLAPADDVVVCRCEGVTAGAVRAVVAQGVLGPNQAKAFLRAGMGPCQGRMCGATVSNLIAAARGVGPDAVGSYRVRPPLKPLTVGELAGAFTA